MKTTLSAVALVILLLVVGVVYLYVTQSHTGPTATSHNLSADLYPLYGGLTWGAEAATTTMSLSGYQVTSQPIRNISDLATISTPFEQYYKNKLLPLGWSEDISLAAGGPGAELTAYKKGSAYILLSYHTIFHAGGVNEPVACPCDVTFSIFSGSRTAADYKNTSYIIDGQPVTLTNGISATPAAPGSASTVTTQYFGNEAVGDLDGDGIPDVAFILTQNTGGSGTFYYAVAALKNENGYLGTNGVLLGDRIAPQTTQIQNGELIVNYAARPPGEPMTGQPSVGVSKYLKIENGSLVENP